MEKLSILLLSVTTMILFTQCSNSSADKLCNDVSERGKIISVLMNNDAYMNQVMDSMRTKHPETILSSLFIIAKDDHKMQEGMMENMTGMCKIDSSTCKMLMGKTMDMCDMDKSKCDMMMGSMQEHPNVKKSVQEVMCGMKGM